VVKAFIGDKEVFEKEIDIKRVSERVGDGVLEEELRRRKIKEAKEAAKRVRELFSRILEEEIVNRINKARKER